MLKEEVREYILGLLQGKLTIFDISESELKDGFDLVKSGLLDSMAFVDLVAEIEEKYDIEIDFEKVADNPDFTSMGSLIDIITNA